MNLPPLPELPYKMHAPSDTLAMLRADRAAVLNAVAEWLDAQQCDSFTRLALMDFAAEIRKAAKEQT